ncbi:hypothetical protein MSAN_00462200 [Mycena sanguinolenta]|uniref:Uncharacterized protein n=1 Tax=Mycena sanguinolenta TaxID=230812 RepID=A0A8H6ZE45_9AGAR|nr:hypothetical protein MSAN_00462200 [Mycena sanguinolenta]
MPYISSMQRIPPERPISPSLLAALQQSADRAAAWAAEAQEERDATHDARIQARIQDWHDCGFEWFTVDQVQDEVTIEYDRLVAWNAFGQFVPQRFGKFLRARIRRYRRLKYLYELVHPPFIAPVLPAVLQDTEHGRNIIAFLRNCHEFEEPPFTHPEFRRDPSNDIWLHSGDISHRQRWDSPAGWNVDPSQWTQADDLPSPDFPHAPLPS